MLRGLFIGWQKRKTSARSEGPSVSLNLGPPRHLKLIFIRFELDLADISSTLIK